MEQIGIELSALQKKALAGTLTESDMQGGTFTLVREREIEPDLSHLT